MPVRAVAPELPPPARENGAGPASVPEPPLIAEKLLLGVDVLVVDDEVDARELVAAVLARCGAQVRTASSVEDALRQLTERRPDVLLSDIGLPNEDGFALIRRVREIDPQIPAGALTAYATSEDHRRALAAGFHAHVSKPVEPAALALLVASLCGRGGDSPRPTDKLEHRAVAG
jgi:CheY-like chemotaxis protein